MAASRDHVTELPAWFPAYCISFLTGMNRYFEIKALEIEGVGKTMGTNLFVADWDIEHPYYLNVGARLSIPTAIDPSD
jgi:hypothetical protein